MSNKQQLSKQRTGTVINRTSKKQEKRLNTIIHEVIANLEEEFAIKIKHDSNLHLNELVDTLRHKHPKVEFTYKFATSSMRPDGGILSIISKKFGKMPILITEVKNQGTNVQRQLEGKVKQAKGNAIERLGKNVIGFRTFLLHEDIFPFICFGDGCDFDDKSSILDRVITIAMFGKLNVVRVLHVGAEAKFNRGSFFFREKPWTPEEMKKLMCEVAEKSINYYFCKYGKGTFEKIQ